MHKNLVKVARVARKICLRTDRHTDTPITQKERVNDIVPAWYCGRKTTSDLETATTSLTEVANRKAHGRQKSTRADPGRRMFHYVEQEVEFMSSADVPYHSAPVCWRLRSVIHALRANNEPLTAVSGQTGSIEIWQKPHKQTPSTQLPI